MAWTVGKDLVCGRSIHERRHHRETSIRSISLDCAGRRSRRPSAATAPDTTASKHQFAAAEPDNSAIGSGREQQSQRAGADEKLPEENAGH